MPEDLLAEPVWPDTPATTTETDSPENPENGEPKGDGGTDKTPTDTKTETAKAQETDAAKVDEKKDEQKPADLPKDPITRSKAPIDYILERKQKQLERAKAEKLAKINKEIRDEGGEIDDDDEDDSIAPEDKEALKKAVDKELGPIKEKMQQQEFEKEVLNFVGSNPVAKHATPAELATLKTYAQHPSRRDVPLESIMLEVLGFDRIMKIGAAMEKEASKAALSSKVGATVSGKKDEGSGSMPNFDNMTDAEFDLYQAKVMGRG